MVPRLTTNDSDSLATPFMVVYVSGTPDEFRVECRPSANNPIPPDSLIAIDCKGFRAERTGNLDPFLAVMCKLIYESNGLMVLTPPFDEQEPREFDLGNIRKGKVLTRMRLEFWIEDPDPENTHLGSTDILIDP